MTEPTITPAEIVRFGAGEQLVEPRALRPGAGAALVADWLGRYTTPTTRATLADALKRAARLLGTPDPVDVDWRLLDSSDVGRIRRGLAELYAPSTAGQTWLAVSSVLQHAWRRGELEQGRLDRLLDQPAMRGSRLPPGRALALEEVKALVAIARTPDPAAARAGAILALAYGCGFRRSEVCAARPEFITRGAEDFIRIVGKGGKERQVPFEPKVLALLDRWLAVRGPGPGFLVCEFAKRGGHVLTEQTLTPRSVWAIVRKLCRAAGVERVSPHDLRRTFATELLDKGVPIEVVQRLLGHSSPATTSMYDRNRERGKAEAVKLLGGFD